MSNPTRDNIGNIPEATTPQIEEAQKQAETSAEREASLYQNRGNSDIERRSLSSSSSSELLRTNLSQSERDIMFETDKAQRDKIDKAIAQIKNHFSEITPPSNKRAQNALKTITLSFIDQITNVSADMDIARIQVSKDLSLDKEEKVKKISKETLASFDYRITEILSWSENFLKDMKKDGGKNTLQRLLQAEDEIIAFMSGINSDPEMKEALSFALNFSLDEVDYKVKEERVFINLAKRILEKPEDTKVITLIISKLKISQIKKFRDNYLNEGKAVLIDRIVKDKDNLASLLFIEIYGENEFTKIHPDKEKSDLTVLAARETKAYAQKAEAHLSHSIGASNPALDMMSGTNLLGIAGVAWGTATAGFNLFAAFGSGKFMTNPAEAIEGAIKNPFIWLGAGAAYTGFGMVSEGSIDSAFQSLTPKEEKVGEAHFKTKNFFKNLMISDSDPRNKLITKNPAAIYALGDFGKSLYKALDIKDIEDLDKNLLTKKFFFDHLDLMISEAKEESPEKKELESLKNYIKDIPYDNKSFAELVIAVLYSDIPDENISKTQTNYQMYIQEL